MQDQQKWKQVKSQQQQQSLLSFFGEIESDEFYYLEDESVQQKKRVDQGDEEVMFIDKNEYEMTLKIEQVDVIMPENHPAFKVIKVQEEEKEQSQLSEEVNE